MSAGTFDPAAFLDQTTSESGSTSYTPVPVGEYNAVVDGDPVFRPWTAKDGLSSGVALDLNWMIDDQKVKDELQRDKVVVRQGIMLDLTEGGDLDWRKGRNVKLGQVREALGLNEPGRPFSPRMLAGKVAKVVVTHRPDKNTGEIYAEIKNVAPLR